MTTLTMDHHGPSGVASTRRPSTWPPGHAEDLRDPVAASAASSASTKISPARSFPLVLKGRTNPKPA